jgi:hypothetical protein
MLCCLASSCVSDGWKSGKESVVSTCAGQVPACPSPKASFSTRASTRRMISELLSA